MRLNKAFWLIVATFFANPLYVRAETRTSFYAEEPFGKKTIEYVRVESPEFNPLSDIILFREPDSLALFKKSKFPIVFIADHGAPPTAHFAAVTYNRESEVGAAKMARSIFKKDSAIIVLFPESREDVLIHETQHAEDYTAKVDLAISTDLGEMLGLRPGQSIRAWILTSFLEWRAYSKQIANLHEKKDSSRAAQSRNTFKLLYLPKLKDFGAAVRNKLAENAESYCRFLRRFEIKNTEIKTQDLAEICVDNP